MKRIVGSPRGRARAAASTGVFEAGVAKESYLVIPGSATGELSGLVGEGHSALGHGTEWPFTLSYEMA